MSAGVIPPIQIVDADTHLVEPPDLWTARMPSRWADMVPHVRWDEQHQEEAWFVGDQRLAPVAAAAQAGWSEYPPDHPRRWADADPATWDPKLRLGRMDEYGIHAQVLYPNVALFNSAMLQEVDEADVQLETVQAYNDYQTEFAQRRARSLPSDDVAAVLGPRRDAAGDAALRRRRAQGHRLLPGPVGIRAARLDRPALGPDVGGGAGDAPAGELPHRVGRHVAARPRRPSRQRAPRQLRVDGRVVLHGQRPHHRAVDLRRHLPPVPGTRLRLGRERHRVDPVRARLARLAVEELRCRTSSTPSTTCCRASTSQRQIYGCFWFERDTALFAIERLGADNVLFETDFPHPTSMSPGPATAAVAPDVLHRRGASAASPDDTLRKILHDNAARIYHLDP